MKISISLPHILSQFENVRFQQGFERLSLAEKLLVSRPWTAPTQSESGFTVDSVDVNFHTSPAFRRLVFNESTPSQQLNDRQVITNNVDINSGAFETLQDFAFRLSEENEFSEFFITVNSNGTLSATHSLVSSEHLDGFNLRLQNLGHGIFVVSVWNPNTRFWHHLNLKALIDPTHLEHQAQQSLVNGVFKTRFSTDTANQISFIQKNSLYDMLEYFDAFVISEKMKANAERHLRMQRPLSFAALELISDGVSKNFLVDGSSEMKIAEAAGEVYQKLFGHILSADRVQNLPGYAAQHLEKFLQSYSVHYMQVVLDLNLHLESLDLNGLSKEEYYLNVSSYLRQHNTKAFSDKTIINQLIALCESIQTEPKLTDDAKHQFIEITHIYHDVFDAYDRREAMLSK